MKPARMQQIRPFYVMEVLEEAFRLEAEGKDIIHLQMGEPDFDTPDPITRAGIEALEQKRTHYVQALGIPQLRRLIADAYPATCRPPVERVTVTPGSSGGLQMIFACLLDPGDEVLLADPGYPCNANFIHLYGGIPRFIASGPDTNYQLTADSIRAAWNARTKAVLIGTPSNPTGSIVSPEEMTRIAQTVRELGGQLIVDEIYHGLVYDTPIRSALHDGDDVFIVNSFSKYYGMTGWRLGWLVVPERYLEDITRLSQNLFPQGAFYVYADCSAFTDDSDAFALRLLREALVGVAPGKDFGSYRQNVHIRFSYANSMENLERAVQRMRDFLANN